MIFRLTQPSIGPLTLDLELGSSHRVSVVVTDNPTEDGRLDGGFKRSLPRRVTMRGAITAQDMSLFLAVPFYDGTRHVDAWQVLKALWTSTETFDVVTNADKYKNCTGEGELVWDQQPGDDNILIFTGTFREMQVGKVDIRPLAVQAAEKAASLGTSLGKQGTAVL